jgi:DNA-binding PadR family transcriptional regulator
MFPKYADVATLLLAELTRRGGEARPSDKDAQGRNVYEALADSFDLPSKARDFKIYEDGGKGRSKWENVVRWARNDLVKEKKLDGSQRGVWKLTEAGRKELAEVEAEEVTQRGFVPTRRIGLEEFKSRLKKMEETGEIGEAFVLQQERTRLTSLGRPDLAERVRHVSLEDVAAGYDILSFDETGNAIFIEVKASKTANASFELTSNEFVVAGEKGAAYVIHRVINAGGPAPEVLKFENPAALVASGRMKLKPTSYRVTFLDTD